MARERDYQAEYQRRIQRGLERGISKSQAAGHPKKGEELASKKRVGGETPSDLSRMAEETPWEELTPYQRKLMRGIPDEPVTTADIARHTGIPESIIIKRIREYRSIGIKPSSLVYRSSRGFFAKPRKGSKRWLIFYVVYSPYDENDFLAAFGTASAIVKAIREKVRAIASNSPHPEHVGDSGCPSQP